MAGIEKLHQQDVAATLASDLKKLSALFTDDGVLFNEGQAPLIGRPAYEAWVGKEMAQHPMVKVLKYVPDIRDVQIAGDVAYEWGYFDAVQQNSPGAQPVVFRGRLLRVLKRQRDGAWKFVRVMWQPAEK